MSPPVRMPSLPSRLPEVTRLPEGPEFLDLRGLCERLQRELPERPQVGMPMDEGMRARVEQVLRRTRLNPKEWSQHAVFRKGRYTRSIVGHSPGQFVAMLLCWERGQESPIHNHTGAHCFMRVLSGKLRDERFSQASGGVSVKATQEGFLDADVEEESVGFMHDELGLHRISNPSLQEPAVSLHIYSPPFSQCQVFPPTGGVPRTVAMVNPGVPEWEPLLSGMAFSKRSSLRELCQSLSQRPSSNMEDSEEVLQLVHAMEPSLEERSAYCSSAHFSEFRCVQHVVHHDDNFSVVVSCWSPGQGVPPHSTGRGRMMWMKVVYGTLRHQLFAAGQFPWEEEVEKETVLEQGSSSCFHECAIKRQRFENASGAEAAVSIAVYSPPLTQFTFFTKSGIERRDVLSSSGLPPVVTSWGLARTTGRHYLSFPRLAALLDEEFARGSSRENSVAALLRMAVFNPVEWRAALAGAGEGQASTGLTTGPRHVLLKRCGHYELCLSVWGLGASLLQKGRRSWTLVLEGDLEEQAFSHAPEPEDLPVRVGTLKEESVSFLDSSEVVLRSCASDVPCVTLHVYDQAAAVLAPAGRKEASQG
eukprot:CAMPEP_0170653154 /NCGR_PEP_ID=MMETSP0224-20130122/47261_1 /TAXON_ID=285029 /ORGANISM="Togula jolla, Strain CCCM 725" /LENGTH=588 /DNA_ID=CAMNT_0010985017 /DNA_START=52 /DNA_END=1818 /DNA_ORIENTATION=+